MQHALPLTSGRGLGLQLMNLKLLLEGGVAWVPFVYLLRNFFFGPTLTQSPPPHAGPKTIIFYTNLNKEIRLFCAFLKIVFSSCRHHHCQYHHHHHHHHRHPPPIPPRWPRRTGTAAPGRPTPAAAGGRPPPWMLIMLFILYIIMHIIMMICLCIFASYYA